MKLYENIQFLISYKITAYKLSKESDVPISTIAEVKTKNRELKGNQIDKLYTTLKKLELVDSLDSLFYKDLSESEWYKP